MRACADTKTLRRHGSFVRRNCPISASNPHLEHDPDASLGHAGRVLRRTNGLGCRATTDGRERASVRGGRDGDGQAHVDKAACGSTIVGASCLERARGERPRASAGASDIVVAVQVCALHLGNRGERKEEEEKRSNNTRAQ